MLLTASPLEGIVAIVTLAVTVHLLRNKYSNGIHHIPGPFFASFTDLYRLYLAWTGTTQTHHLRLHEKYGPIVRLGPRTVSINDPDACRTIYGIKSGFTKSAFYPVQATIAKGQTLQSLFNTRDEGFHARLRRAVASGYAMSTLVEFEPLVESTITAFLGQLEERYATQPEGEKKNNEEEKSSKALCDFGQWLQFYAFDVIGELTFSKRLGFVERGEDVDGIIGSLEWLLRYAAVIGQLPILDSLFLKNPLRLWLSSIGYLNANSPVVKFSQARMQPANRESTITDNRSSKTLPSPPKRRDFLARFLEAQKKDPEFITTQKVLTLTVTNMFAGSDTTAISLRTIFYNILRNPDVQQRLRAELSALRQQQGPVDDAGGGYLKWTLLSEAPYLSAVIKESLRCHPAVGLLLERIVPATGLRVCGGIDIPSGTIVGCNAWVLHQNEEIFGPDPGSFRPARWIDADKEQRRLMDGALFSFGAGARSCIGRNISLLEMYKLVPAVLERFQIELADPDRGWKLFNAWFVKQSEFYVTISRKVAP
ncbi:cytochrome P450 [Aspergillus germanicus]